MQPTSTTEDYYYWHSISFLKFFTKKKKLKNNNYEVQDGIGTGIGTQEFNSRLILF